MKGRHGKGAALHAKLYHGAKTGIGEGLSGNTYLLPTKDENIKTLSLFRIKKHAEKFIKFAGEHPEMMFNLTPVGTGLAGYQVSNIAPMFSSCPGNVILPDMFKLYLSQINETNEKEKI